MAEIEKKGSFFLGKIFDPATQSTTKKPLFYESKHFTTHAICVGMTGSGKTGLGIGLLEEAALSGIPALIIDPKGDLGNLLLTFPHLDAAEFKPWVDQAEAERKSQTIEEYAKTTAATWKDGLSDWGMDEARIKKLRSAVDMTIYTPASNAGIPLSILNSFATPSDELLSDPEALRDRTISTTSSLLGLIGIKADPVKSREHILISTIIDYEWKNKNDLDLPSLIKYIQKPPFKKIGVLDIDTFYSQNERQTLARNLNNLLASPGFQVWMQGEPLDIQKLLYTKEGKPKLAIITISHLSDSERMFFVTLFLNQVLSWTRSQSGTSNLRALLYMDEIFGFFPPVAMPPSKTPMLTLLKQARAFGLGIMLCTQNPADIDYKGLSNCGTWFIGKLQTERDRTRVLDGLNSASNGELDSASLSQMIANITSRVFILRSIYFKDPLLFQTRWTLSYLRGPMTLPQIQLLMKDIPRKLQEKQKKSSQEKPMAPLGVEEFFLPSKDPNAFYTPKILGFAKLHFVDSKNKVDIWKDYAIAGSLDKDSSDIKWEKGEEISQQIHLLTKEIPKNLNFDELPDPFLSAKNYSLFGKSFADYLYQTQNYSLFIDPQTKLISNEAETEADFRIRLNQQMKTNIDLEVKKLRDSYQIKIKKVEDKIVRAQNKVASEQSQVGRQKMDTIISFFTALIGALLGRGVTKDTISQTGTSIRRAGRISKEKEESLRAEESLKSLQEELQNLKLEQEHEINQIINNMTKQSIELNEVKIKPRKGDILIDKIALVWIEK